MNQFDLLFLPIEIRYLKLCIMLADIYKVAICDLKRKKEIFNIRRNVPTATLYSATTLICQTRRIYLYITHKRICKC